MDPRDINLYVEKKSGGEQSDVGPGPAGGQQDAGGGDAAKALADAASALSGAANALGGGRSTWIAGRTAGGQREVSVASLSFETKQRIHSALQETLAAELNREGATLGLRPGDNVAISSSVGQSISF